MKTKRFPIACIGLLGISVAHGELLISESFEYDDFEANGAVAADDTGLIGTWQVSGMPNGRPGEATFLYDSLEFPNHFEMVGGALRVRHTEQDSPDYSGLGVAVGLGVDLDVPVLWTSTLIQVGAPATAYYDDWRVEQRLSPAANSGNVDTGLRIIGRVNGSGTGPISRAAIGADHLMTSQATGSIEPNVTYLYVTRSTITDGRITATRMFIFDADRYAAYLLNASANPAAAESLLESSAFAVLADEDTDAGNDSETITSKEFIQFALGGGPLGTFDDVRFGTTLGDVVNLEAVPEFEMEIASAALTPTSGTIVIKDVEVAQTDLSRLGEFNLSIDGSTVPTTITKSGDATTIAFDFAPERGETYYFTLVAPRVGGGVQTFYDPPLDAYSHPLALPGADATVGTWTIRSYPTAAENPMETNLDAVIPFIDEAAGNPFTEEQNVPVLNHSDPETNPGPTGRGNFNNDFEIVGNTDQAENWVVVAKTKINIPAAGTYTFSVHTDDGFSMRVSGASGGQFIAKGGTGIIDPGDNQTILLNGPSGDSDTRGTYEFDAAGTYDISFVSWDSGGGGYYELAWAKGSFTADRDTNTWQLVGSPLDPAVTAIPFQDRHIPTLAAPTASTGNFSVRTYLQAGAPANLQDVSNFLRLTTRSPEDADGLTVDGEVPVLNATDPEEAGGAFTVGGDLPFIGNTSAVDDNFITTAKSQFNLATEKTLTFWIRADDGAMIRIKGVGATADPKFSRATQGAGAADGRFEMSNPNELFFNGTSGDVDTRGIITLAPGAYELEFIHFESAGGSSYELTSADGAWPHGTNPPTGWQLVGFRAASNLVLVPAIAEPGWTVETSTPGRPEFVFADLAAANAAIDATLLDSSAPAAKSSVWDRVDFTDPDAGSEGSFSPSNPWPLDVPGVDDDNYAMRASGILNITSAGIYDLGYQGDDGGYLEIEGPLEGGTQVGFSSILETNHGPEAQLVETVPGSDIFNRMQTVVGTGNSRTIGSIDLPVGTYRLSALMFEGGGGSWWELIGAKSPVDPNFNYPLLRTGGERTIVILNGLQLGDQTGTQTPHTGPLLVSSFATTGSPVGTATLSFTSTAGAIYTVQASEDLETWTNIRSGVTASGANTSVDVNITSLPSPLDQATKVFFRVVTN